VRTSFDKETRISFLKNVLLVGQFRVKDSAPQVEYLVRVVGPDTADPSYDGSLPSLSPGTKKKNNGRE